MDIASALAGGDRRSIGRANEVASFVLAHAEHLPDLIDGLGHADPVIRMRCADAAEKVRRYQHRPAVELYDLATDPLEWNNLADDPAQAETLAALRAKLDAWMSQQGDQGQITEMEALDHLSRNRQKAENAEKSGKKGGKKRPTQQG